MAQQMDVLPRRDQPSPGSKVTISLSGEQFLRLIASPVQRMQKMQEDLEFRVGEGKILASAIDSDHVSGGIYCLDLADLPGSTIQGSTFSTTINLAPFVKVAATIDPAEHVELVITPAAITFAGITIAARKDRSKIMENDEIKDLDSFNEVLSPKWVVTMTGKARAWRPVLDRAKVLSTLLILRAVEGRVVASTYDELASLSLPIDMDTAGSKCEGIYSVERLEHAIGQAFVASKLEWTEEIVVRLGDNIPVGIVQRLGPSSSFTCIIAPRVEDKQDDSEDED
jgi:hypothetical protein